MKNKTLTEEKDEIETENIIQETEIEDWLIN